MDRVPVLASAARDAVPAAEGGLAGTNDSRDPQSCSGR